MSQYPVARVPQGLSAFGEWFSEVFRLWSAQWQVWVLQGLILFGIVVVPMLLVYAFFFIGMMTTVGHGQQQPRPEEVFGIMFTSYGVMFLISFLGMALMPGMVRTALKQMRGEPISAGDIFSGMRFFWGYFVVALLTWLGVIGCYVGSLVVWGLLYLALPLMIDRKMPTWEAIVLSWNTAKQNFWLFILFPFVVSILASAGSIACYIGIIATMSFYPIAQAVAYERTFSETPVYQGGGMPSGSMPPPPYMPPPPSA